jgi:hypothetical protein
LCYIAGRDAHASLMIAAGAKPIHISNPKKGRQSSLLFYR